MVWGIVTAVLCVCSFILGYAVRRNNPNDPVKPK